MDWYKKQVRAPFKNRAKKLKKREESQGLILSKNESFSPKLNGPAAVFCFDKANELLTAQREAEEDDSEMRFLALRRALRNQTKSTNFLDEKEFFAVMLDTASKVSSFSPPKELHPSAKWVEPDKLYPPIYKIDTMDLFARDVVNGVPKVHFKPTLGDEDLRTLFSLGRPLWGAMAEKVEITKLARFAQRKVHGGLPDAERMDDAEALALLSYRLFYYVMSPSLADQLTSGYLRYIHGGCSCRHSSLPSRFSPI